MEGYEFNGTLYTNVGEYFDVVRHEYVHGDASLAKDSLETYGFDVNDLDIIEQREDV